MKKIVYIFLSVLLFQGAAAQQTKNRELSGYTEGYNPELQKIDKSLNFLLMGDFGRYGQFYQKEVATQMGKAAATIESEFVISVGDNFYPNGVQSTTDYSWKASFENVYTDYSLQTDWFVTLGNHDHRGKVQSQIDYSDVSRRWHMPSTYFKKEFDLEDGNKVLVLFMDTSPFIDKYYEADSGMSESMRAQDTTAQKKWLLKELATTDKKVTWKIVVGHHPLYSGGKRKNSKETKSFENKFAAIFDTNKVDAYFCGHEHDLQIIKPKGRYTTQFLSGSACTVRPSGAREGTLFFAEKAGFMTFAVSNSKLLAQVVDDEGKILFRTQIDKK
ncbi:metallophosphoesterase [Flavobacterium sp. TMP13]|uniref:metallophosphoesterase n=1 Tax=Flavobacterium sp. TMP13 TaxID=3425950 RepID=UPI003D784863